MKHTQRHRNIYIIIATVVLILASLFYNFIITSLLALLGAVIPTVGFWILSALIFLIHSYRAFTSKQMNEGSDKIAEIADN